MTTKQPLLQVKHLKQYFPIKGGFFGGTVNHVKAVDDISFNVYEGETLSIVGESGCGKSTTGRSILRLEQPTAGEVLFDDKNVRELTRSELRQTRKDLQIIFQDPYASINPRQTVADVLMEALAIQHIVPKAERRQRAIDLLETVGLAAYQIDRYPHEFSGGQRQRIGIARALAVNPKLIICDEAVSALDVSIQAQVINLLKQLQRDFKLTYIFISHDLGVVRHISDRIIVMYLGKIVEIADKHSLFDRAQHPYTQALLSSIPTLDPTKKTQRVLLSGEVPSPINPPQGCRFHTRCPHAQEKCRQEETQLLAAENSEAGHEVACHYAGQLPARR
ncbi:MAG: ABC transporter ATP-binding protein [Saccharospirillum sp.]